MQKTILALFIFCLSAVLCAGTENIQQQDVAFVVLGKTANHRQHADGSLRLLNYHFFAEIFLQENGNIRSAQLLPADVEAAALDFKGTSSVLEVHGGRYQSEAELDQAFADGRYVFAYRLSDGTQIRQPVDIHKHKGVTRIPQPISIYLWQDGKKVAPDAVDPGQNLRVSWSHFANGSADPAQLVDDLVFVVTGDCRGERIDHSGAPFGKDKFLTFAATSYEIPAAKLAPGESFQLFVEQADMDTGRHESIPQIATYAATSFLDIHTSGERQSSRPACPALMPAMDGGQTDRPAKH